MDFGEAIQALNNGEMLQRLGWSEKGLFVFKQVPAVIIEHIVPNMQSLPEKVKDEFVKRFKTKLVKALHYNNQLAIVDQVNNIRGWAPSVSDCLADDWIIYTTN